jgi:hypothetical protein
MLIDIVTMYIIKYYSRLNFPLHCRVYGSLGATCRCREEAPGRSPAEKNEEERSNGREGEKDDIASDRWVPQCNIG